MGLTDYTIMDKRYFNSGVEYERDRILKEIDKLEEMSKKTRTPLFQETIFKKVREIVNADSR